MKPANMLMASELYKGIKFVRISSLPLDQKNQILQSINPENIIKILHNDILLNDCVQYKHYEAWYKNIFAPFKTVTPTEVNTALAIAS